MPLRSLSLTVRVFVCSDQNRLKELAGAFVILKAGSSGGGYSCDVASEKMTCQEADILSVSSHSVNAAEMLWRGIVRKPCLPQHGVKRACVLPRTAIPPVCLRPCRGNVTVEMITNTISGLLSYRRPWSSRVY